MNISVKKCCKLIIFFIDNDYWFIINSDTRQNFYIGLYVDFKDPRITCNTILVNYE